MKSHTPLSDLEISEWADKVLSWMQELNCDNATAEKQLRMQGLQEECIAKVMALVNQRMEVSNQKDRNKGIFGGLGMLMLAFSFPFFGFYWGISDEYSVPVAGTIGAIGLIMLLVNIKK